MIPFNLFFFFQQGTKGQTFYVFSHQYVSAVLNCDNLCSWNVNLALFMFNSAWFMQSNTSVHSKENWKYCFLTSSNWTVMLFHHSAQAAVTSHSKIQKRFIDVVSGIFWTIPAQCAPLLSRFKTRFKSWSTQLSFSYTVLSLGSFRPTATCQGIQFNSPAILPWPE